LGLNFEQNEQVANRHVHRPDLLLPACPKRHLAPGAVTRCYKTMCAVCGRTDIYEGHDKERDV
jgi:hypothetical protein